MGKLSKLRRSRKRMTNYNISKACEILEVTEIQVKQIEILDKQNMLLSNKCKDAMENALIMEQENVKLRNKIYSLEITGNGEPASRQQVNEALIAQKERHNIRHESVVKLLQERYKVKLNNLSESYQSQIDVLTSKLKSSSEELSIAKNCLLSTNIRKPVFSPGRYNGIPP